MTGQQPSFAVVIGRGIREVRDAASVTADDLASAARAVGLAWHRSTVAKIETGRRSLTPEELLLLPSLLTATTGEPVTLADLISGPAQLTPDLVASADSIRDVLKGRSLIGLAPTSTGLEDALRASGDVHEVESRRDAEVTAARRIRYTPDLVSIAAHRLWGQGLTEERDERAERQLEERPEMNRRVVRGHVSRDLEAELLEVLDAWEDD